MRHFGLVLQWADWEALGAQLEAKGATFVIPPKVRFKGKAGEQGTMFVRGPGINVLEFKSFRDFDSMFAT